jgi:hypothetical protein
MRSGELIKISLNIWETHCHRVNCVLQVGRASLTFFSYSAAEQGGDHPASSPLIIQPETDGHNLSGGGAINQRTRYVVGERIMNKKVPEFYRIAIYSRRWCG